MSSKMMLGLLLSATVGLGAAAASATEPPADYPPPAGYPGEQPEYTKKAVIIIDKDGYGKPDYSCKVPVKVRGDYLESDDPKTIKYNNQKHRFTITCKFKEQVKYPNLKKYFDGVHKEGFLCKAVIYDHTFKTNYSKVDVTFKHRQPRNDEYGKMGSDYYGPDKKMVEAHVVLKCMFEKKGGYQPQPYPTDY